MEKQLKKLLLILLCFVGVQALAQDRMITGQVVDQTGLPIPGVSVYVKNTTIGTTTGMEGRFSLQVPNDENAVIVFSSLGFVNQEIIIGTQENFQITLDESQEGLDEIVLVGYGTQRRANLTAAVSTIDTEVLESRPITDVARGLQGVSPGLTITSPSGQIGENPTIKLRGNVGTLGTGAGAEPLILVDNVEVPNLQMINPEDIEDISVLKDAASTSIYGARAAWGVILITTKQGKRGTDPTVRYSNNFSWATPTTTPEVAPAAE